jgi:hypothetical protein
MRSFSAPATLATSICLPRRMTSHMIAKVLICIALNLVGHAFAAADEPPTNAESSKATSQVGSKSGDSLELIMAALRVSYNADGNATDWTIKDVRSLGENFVVAMHATRLASTIAPKNFVLFDDAGKVLGDAGVGQNNAGTIGEESRILTLGTTDCSFAWLHRPEKHGEFSMVSELYLIKDKLPLAFRAYHYLNDTAYTSGPKQAAEMGMSCFIFRSKDHLLRIGDVAVGFDEKRYPALIKWDAKKLVFRGPSGLKHDNIPVYEMDLEGSALLIPTDRE